MFRRSRFRFQRFRLSITRRRVYDQRLEQMMRNVRNFIDRAIESFLVCFRRLGESAKLPNELKRRRANFILRRRRLKVMQRFDGSAHAPTINNSQPTFNYFAMQTFSGSVKNPPSPRLRRDRPRVSRR